MSYATIIITQKEANNYINEHICLESTVLLKNQILEVKEREYMYLIVKEKEFSPPYFPTKKGKAWNNKETFLKVLNNINDLFILKKLFFVCLGEDETIHATEKYDIDEIISLLRCDAIKENVLYKIKHNYLDFVS